jgi:hypothetical protein
MASSDRDLDFDLRTVQRYIKAGRVDRAEYRTYIETLPDVSNLIMARDEGGDDDGYEQSPDEPEAEAAAPAAPDAAMPAMPAVPPAVPPVAPPVSGAAPAVPSAPSVGEVFAPPPMEVPIKD